MVNRLLIGDCCEQLATLPAECVQTCVTSPPYWGLRDYGHDDQIGLEDTPEEYVEKLVAVFREVRRVLRDDGTLWLNLGDSYNGSAPNRSGQHGFSDGRANRDKRYSVGGVDGLKPKDLCGMPWRLAFALQADGWYLRSDIIWAKPNPMPESVTDRPTKAHEYVFLLAKSARYYYDSEAIREPATYGNHRRTVLDNTPPTPPTPPGTPHHTGLRSAPGAEAGRNKRTVWTVASQPYSGAHFATFPPDLIKPCILAGTSEAGCCAECGAPRERVVDIDRPPGPMGNGRGSAPSTRRALGSAQQDTNGQRTALVRRTTQGWRPTCDHADASVVPCIVLDPFLGSGTTAQVAQDLGRRWIGCEVNRDYEPLIRRRTAQASLWLMAGSDLSGGAS